MLFRDEQECRRCKGEGVVKIKGTADVVCSCTAGRMLASWIPTRIEMWQRKGGLRG